MYSNTCSKRNETKRCRANEGQLMAFVEPPDYISPFGTLQTKRQHIWSFDHMFPKWRLVNCMTHHGRLGQRLTGMTLHMAIGRTNHAQWVVQPIHVCWDHNFTQRNVWRASLGPYICPWFWAMWYNLQVILGPMWNTYNIFTTGDIQ